MNGEKKEIIGFKINDYVPLSHRILKQIDKMKHLAEKKRLLYVALTRAEHDVVISALLKEKKEGDITLREDSYLSMILNALEVNVQELFDQNSSYCISIDENRQFNAQKVPVAYVDHILNPITFQVKASASATNRVDDEENSAIDSEAAKLGTITHQIIERYWKHFSEHKEIILDKVGLFETKDRDKVKRSMESFYASSIYSILQNGTTHHFELEFNNDGKRGFIDFIYFDRQKEGWVIVDFKTGQKREEKIDKYQKQLEFYKDVMEHLHYKVTDTQLLWL